MKMIQIASKFIQFLHFLSFKFESPDRSIFEWIACEIPIECTDHAEGLKEIGAAPAGQPNAFCEPV